MTVLICLEQELQDQALALSQRFALMLAGNTQLQQPGFHLCLDANGLSLQQGGIKGAGKKRNQVQVNFSQGAVAHRRKFGGGQGQDIAKAIGISRYKPSVIDATAGLGRDSFVLATLGCRVTAYERQPEVAALLEDGLKRGALDPEISDIIQRITLQYGSSHDLLTRSEHNHDKPDVVYLDPMFEHDGKQKAQVKKDMQAFRQVVGHDVDADELLAKAYACARCRVVVKRARKARPLADKAPSYSLTGKANRFDIYVKAKVAPLPSV